MVQILRPNNQPSQVWSPNTGTFCWQCIDEAVADDSDYMYGMTTTQFINLSAGRDPGVNTDFKIYVRIQATSSGAIKVRLYQDATLITTISDLSSAFSFAQKILTIPEADAAKITDFSKLKLSFTGSDPMGYSYVSHAYMEIPDAPIKNGLEMGCSF